MSVRKAAALIALVLSLILIAAVTLSPTGEPPRAGFRWLPSISADAFVEAVLNALLFAPLGAATRLLGAAPLTAAALAAFVSIAVEMTQLFVVTGRTAELQDIVANTLGGWGGWVIYDRTFATPAKR